MDLTDTLQNAGAVLFDTARLAVIVYGFKKLVIDKYIPFAEKLQEKYDKEEKEARDDSRIDGK